MTSKLFICLSLLLFAGCKSSQNETVVDENNNVVVADKFVDAFYSFDRDSLASVLSSAESSQPNLLYYQKWAECGNYELVKRADCIIRNDSLVTCPAQ
jgi:uncharacterized protein YcfL